MLNLKQLEESLDKALDAETKESAKDWMDARPQVIHTSNDWALHNLLFNNPEVKERIAIEKEVRESKNTWTFKGLRKRRRNN